MEYKGRLISTKTTAMAGIQPQQTSSSVRCRHSLKIDMTPMVDLGFLLITFFIFTTALAHPTVTRLVMPADGPPSEVKESNSLTALLDDGRVWIYKGRWDDAVAQRRVVQTDYNVHGGLGAAIRQKQKELATGSAKDDLVLLIKPLPSAPYRAVVAALDEVTINGVKRYALADASAEEKRWVEGAK